MRGGEGAPAEVLHREGYDLVLGAELWYNEATMDTLATTIADVRATARGPSALIAGKSHFSGWAAARGVSPRRPQRPACASRRYGARRMVRPT